MSDPAPARVLPFPAPEPRTVDQLIDEELLDRERAAWLAQEAARALAALDLAREIEGHVQLNEEDSL